ncbi:3-beta hydroxysteroid dehydrogenase [Paenibacillus crassostreae]|uniref:3-beta hydroxysteroid dehydrogenase n=2 Tax=Paenibacillus crassostreae TaxID=1763538 RepID=A0A167BXF6_9BACL|nr:3-beta hydroxysteroid dehydrogenase [Paenibacillus crassostreae]OAB72551.1 3-beta hydroxysteroid dehydrogenase [Paenibacillus crassostreae]
MKEALDRGYRVTAVVRDRLKLTELYENLNVVEGNIMDVAAVAAICEGHDAVISAFGPVPGAEEELVTVAHSLVDGVRRSGVSRLLIVGEAGGLRNAAGIQWMDTDEYPVDKKALANAHLLAYEIYSNSDLDWTYCSPAAHITAGRRTGQFRIGMDMMILDAGDRSAISGEDYAVAMIDELEDPYFVRARFTIAY